MLKDMEMLEFKYYSCLGIYMNLNESCLLKFLFNPDELKDLSDFFINYIEEFEKKTEIDDN